MRPKPVAIALFVVAAIAGAMIFAWRARPADRFGPIRDRVPPLPLLARGESNGFVGSEVCAGCHPAESAAHARSTHAHTLGPISGDAMGECFRSRQSVEDPALGVVYSVGIKSGKPVYRVRDSAGGRSTEIQPSYRVGSGKVGETLVVEQNGVFTEARLSYYPPQHRWDWTPGQEDESPVRAVAGERLSFERASACFTCHSTMVMREGDRLLPEQSLLNVGCERCHGPGKAHLEAVRAGRAPGPTYGYGAARAETILQLCGQCHRSPTAMNRSPADDMANLPRFAATALLSSKCYLRSAGQLSCVTCHDPHSTELRSPEASYRSCHSGARGRWRPCAAGHTSGCIACHMPALPIRFPVDYRFRMHRIAIYPDASN